MNVTLKVAAGAEIGKGIGEFIPIPGAAGVGKMIGGTMGYGNHVLSLIRQAGIGKVADLVRTAFENPEIALEMLKKASIREGHGTDKTLGMLLRQSAIANGVNAAQLVYGRTN